MIITNYVPTPDRFKDTVKFAELVLPESNGSDVYFYSVAKAKGSAWRDVPAGKTIVDLIDAVQKAEDRAGAETNVYYLTGTSNGVSRKAENIQRKKALYIDIDVGKAPRNTPRSMTPTQLWLRSSITWVWVSL